MRFLSSHFSLGDKIENCSAQFLAVCWIVHVEFKVHRLRDGFSVSGGERMGLCAGRRMGGIWYDLPCWGALFFAPKGTRHGPHIARTEVISLTIFDGPLTV
jgi:hypothetical protein